MTEVEWLVLFGLWIGSYAGSCYIAMSYQRRLSLICTKSYHESFITSEEVSRRRMYSRQAARLID